MRLVSAVRVRRPECERASAAHFRPWARVLLSFVRSSPLCAYTQKRPPKPPMRGPRYSSFAYL